MERLVTTAQAAEILGLSLQGIHYRIRKNQLKSIKKSGKTYVYINDSQATSSNSSKKDDVNETKPENFVYKDIIRTKDEQIKILNKSIKWMKKQYKSEIIRLEKNQEKIISVFNREIELLQSAFNEMRSIYRPQIGNDNLSEDFDLENELISIKEFSLYMKKNNKSEEDTKLIILKAIQNKDKRFIYDKNDKKLLILNEDFSDLI